MGGRRKTFSAGGWNDATRSTISTAKITRIARSICRRRGSAGLPSGTRASTTSKVIDSTISAQTAPWTIR